MKKSSLLLLLLLALFGAAAQDYNTTLWRIVPKVNSSGDDLKSSYLFGTIHLPKQSLLSFSDSVYTAINETDYFFGELNYSGMMEEMSNPDNTDYYNGRLAYLDSASKTPAWAQMVNRMNRRYNVQLKPDSLQQFIEFGTKLTSELYKPDTEEAGIMDIMLAIHAVQLGKKPGGLEPFIRQVSMMYELIDARLKDSTITYDDEAVLMRSMVRWYEQQQLDSIVNLMGTLHPRYNEIIFYRRNRSMADSIAMHLTDKAAFFAVGCGHLPGDSGVISHLRRRGFTVLPVLGREKMSLLVIKDMYKQWQDKTDAAKKAVKEAAPVEEKIEEIQEDVSIRTAPTKKPVKKAAKRTFKKKK